MTDPHLRFWTVTDVVELGEYGKCYSFAPDLGSTWSEVAAATALLDQRQLFHCPQPASRRL